MGARRTEPSDALFRTRQRYYRKNRDKILAQAKLKYQLNRETRLETARKLRESLQIESKMETQPEMEILEPQVSWFQRLKSKFGGRNESI